MKLGDLVSFFLSLFLCFSLLLFFRLIPWSTDVLCLQFPLWASKTWTGRLFASSLHRETGRALVAFVNRASPLSWGFFGFLCKPRNISLFLSSIFLSATFFLYLSLNILADAISPEDIPVSCGFSWILWGLDSGNWPLNRDQKGFHFSYLDPRQTDSPCHSPLGIQFSHCFDHKRRKTLLCSCLHHPPEKSNRL